MSLTFVDYRIEALAGGSPNVVHIPSAVIGIYTDAVTFDNALWKVYTSFDGVTIHQLEDLEITLAENILWTHANNGEYYRLRCAGPYFAIDPSGLDETSAHDLRIMCRGSTI